MGNKMLWKIGLTPLILTLIMVFTSMASGQNIEKPEYVPGELLVKFKPEVNETDIASLKADLGLEAIKILEKIAVHYLKLHKDTAIKKTVDLLRKSPLVEYAEPNYIRYLDTTIPNDPKLWGLLGLNNTGQTGGTPDADIDAPEAWDITTGDHAVVVAVIDSGMDLDHEDLAANLWINSGEIPGNGIDDDENGYIDDVNGWDFRDNDNDPTGTGRPCGGHGTHVAGTIGAKGDNGIGVVGVNWNVTIMPLRVLGPFLKIFCAANDADIIEAILYYTDFNVRVSNNSYGGGPKNAAMENAIRASHSVFAAAAGNSGQNTDVNPHYPSSYILDNIVSVAATDHNDQMAGFSNFGSQSVDLAAPGVNILSTVLNDGYGLLSGTSMASPHVAGAAAQLLADDPGLTNMEIKWRLLKGTDFLGLQVFTRGRLNVNNSLMLESEVVIDLIPAGPTGIQAGNTVDYNVTVRNDGASSKSVNYMVYARIPNGTEVTLQGPFSVNLNPSQSLTQSYNNTVPLSAPTGTYRVLARAWNSGFGDFDEDKENYNVVP